MGKPTAYAVAMKAIERLQGPEISYKSEVCDTFIKKCIALCGGKLDASGTNNIFRNYCSLTADFNWRKPEGLEIGDMLFIREDVSGDTKERYRNDGIGDVNHIGIYVGPIPGYAPEYCVIHSSQSRGKVAASTLKNAWNRRGRLECLDYSDGQSEQELDEEAPETSGQTDTSAGTTKAAPGPGQAMVNTEDGSLWLRKGPGASYDTDGSLPKGTIVDVQRVETGEGGKPWALVSWNKRGVPQKARWCAAWLLLMGDGED